MEPETLAASVARFNAFCAEGRDADFDREPESLGPVVAAPFYAIPLYPGGPNTKGGIRANARRQVLDWEDRPIPRLFTAGEISSAFQFVYQGGGNLAECIAFGRLAGREASAEPSLGTGPATAERAPEPVR
jgi:succinate dehydrogenase/fumarate reductase flavoprotein subunit